MEKLEKEFIGKGDVKGFIFQMIKNHDNKYIFGVKLNKDDKEYHHYEIFKSKKQKEKMIKMGDALIHLKEKELYPNSNSFGVTAKTTKNLEDAYELYNQLLKNGKFAITD